jgi:hypothetical protein
MSAFTFSSTEPTMFYAFSSRIRKIICTFFMPSTYTHVMYGGYVLYSCYIQVEYLLFIWHDCVTVIGLVCLWLSECCNRENRKVEGKQNKPFFNWVTYYYDWKWWYSKDLTGEDIKRLDFFRLKISLIELNFDYCCLLTQNISNDV